MTQYIREQPRVHHQQPQGPPTGYYEQTQGQPRDNRQQMQQYGHGYPPSNAAIGLQFLTPFSTLFFEQEASAGQGMLLIASQRGRNTSIFSTQQAIVGYSAAQKFNIFNEHNQLIMRATEGTWADFSYSLALSSNIHRSKNSWIHIDSEASCHRICCGRNRAFRFRLTNLHGQVCCIQQRISKFSINVVGNNSRFTWIQMLCWLLFLVCWDRLLCIRSIDWVARSRYHRSHTTKVSLTSWWSLHKK